MLHQRSCTKGHHACAIRPLSHGTSVNKQGSFHTREWTRFRAKNYASVRFCRRSRPTTKFLNVCKNFARNVGHVKHYCPFTRSSFCNISQTLRKFRKECWFFFRRVKRAIHTHVLYKPTCVSFNFFHWAVNKKLVNKMQVTSFIPTRMTGVYLFGPIMCIFGRTCVASRVYMYVYRDDDVSFVIPLLTPMWHLSKKYCKGCLIPSSTLHPCK